MKRPFKVFETKGNVYWTFHPAKLKKQKING